MEDFDVHKLPRKELLQSCSDNKIRTAGVKHEDLVRLLQKKLHPPASNITPRATPKPSSQISADSLLSSPKARNRTISPFSSPNAKGKPAERASLPSPGSTSQGRSLRPLLLVDDCSRNNLPEPSPRTPREDQQSATPRKDQESATPGVQSRKPTTTKSNVPPAQRSDLLRKKVNTLSAIGKLQAQERARPAQQSDGSPVQNRNNVASAPTGRQGQETRPQQSDRGASVRSRSSAPATGAPKKNIKSSSLPSKRPGAKSNEALRKGQSVANSEAGGSSPRASEASVAAIAGNHRDLGSRSFNSVSEIATDAGHQVMWEDSDADDAHSVSSDRVSRSGSQSERFHLPHRSTGSKLGRVAYPVWESAHGRRSSLNSSVDSNAPLEKISDLAAMQGEENLISLCSLEDDASFDLVGGAHGLEINSFLDAHSGTPEDVNAATGSHELEQVRNPRVSMADFQENETIAKPVKSMKEQDAVSETVPSTMQKDELGNPGNPIVEHDVATTEYRQEDTATPGVELNTPVAEQEKDAATPLGFRQHDIEISISAPEANDKPVASSEAEGGPVLVRKENAEEEKWLDSTLNRGQNEDSGEEGARTGKNIKLVSERSGSSDSPSHEEPPVQLTEENDPTCCSGKDYTVTSTAECIERVRFNIDSAPLPHPNMERSSVTTMSVDRPDPGPAPESSGGEFDLCAGKSTSPCDELQQDFDIKLRGAQGVSNFGPKHDCTKDRIKTSNLLQSDRNEKVPLLQDGRENENMQLMKRSFPSSILLWCSQMFSAIFRTRSQH